MTNLLGRISQYFRQRKDLSMDDMAKLVGCTKGYIGQLERGAAYKTGKPVVPTVAMLAKFSKVMGLSPDEIAEIVMSYRS